MKKQHAKLLPLIATGIMPSAAVTSALLPAAVTSALLPSPTLAAPGDLDPHFGDLGRLGPMLNGPAWSVEPLDDGQMILGGGRPGYSYYYWGAPYYSPPTNFVSLLTDTGAIAPGFTAAAMQDIQVLDIARQPDGQVVAVGRKNLDGDPETSQLTVFRLAADGSLDPTFATEGIFELSIEEHGELHLATSVALDPDGRIVAAGSRDDTVIVVRLLPDGSLDDSFGAGGIVVGPDNQDFSNDASGARTSILRTTDGGYRLTASNAAGCQLIALTAAGVIDSAFGSAGIATVEPLSGAATYCNSVAAQADGRLVVAGHTAGHGFAVRLLADGQPDPGFSAISVSDTLTNATAVATGADGTVAVAGLGVSGASIMRLQASGDLDVMFGNAGSTFIDLRYYQTTEPVVHDLKIRADGSIVAAGGVVYPSEGFVVRLLGESGGHSPGVLGVSAQGNVIAAEGNEAVVNVRRTGGSAGDVSVAYQFAVDGEGAAVNDVDYTGTAGHLTWGNGDFTDRQIHVPILADSSVEGPEYLFVDLSDVQGGAGLGTSHASVEISPDGSPHGQIRLGLASASYVTTEGESIALSISREYFSAGAVTVTLTPISGTAAAGADFVPTPVTISWADGEVDTKTMDIPIADDEEEEAAESFTVELSNPTGGVVLGQRSTMTVSIAANDRPSSSPTSNGGGGALGFLSMLLLGTASLFRMVARREKR